MRQKKEKRVLVEQFMGYDIYNIGNNVKLTYDAVPYKNIIINAINFDTTNAGYCKLLMSPCCNCGSDTIEISKVLNTANKKFKSAQGFHLFCFVNSTVNSNLSLTTLELNYALQHALNIPMDTKIYKTITKNTYDVDKEYSASITLFRNQVLYCSFYCKVKNNQVYSPFENI